ncbi:MAG: GAF domain-containing protein [Gemmatimonadetes bacterium]|nr:GAF domain-containing protein [Gemmatimonadota bacterium]
MESKTSPVRDEALYEGIGREISSLFDGEDDWIANLANAAAVIYERLGYSWVGFYRAEGGSLVLGPFQGPAACVRIAPGKGVCGTAFSDDAVQVVPDVHAFPGHIACDARSNSEVVVPLHAGGKVWGVLDVDSHRPNDFSPTDVAGLKSLAKIIESALPS